MSNPRMGEYKCYPRMSLLANIDTNLIQGLEHREERRAD